MYSDLFWQVFWHNTLLPIGSDAALYAMLAFDGYDKHFALLTAIMGAAAGQWLNFGFGKFISTWQLGGVTVLTQEKYDMWRGRMPYILPIVCLLSWIPLIGPFAVGVCGFFRAGTFIAALALVVGQGLYYAFQYAQVVGA